MADIVEIENVPPDVDVTEIGTVSNPMDVDFSCIYNRRKRITILAGAKKVLPLPIAIHAAKHLADRIIWRDREKEILKIATKKVMTDSGLVEIVDEKVKFEQEKLAITNYQQKLWDTMKKIVKTDSKFFKDPEARRKATGRAELDSEELSDELEEIGTDILPKKASGKQKSEDDEPPIEV